MDRKEYQKLWHQKHKLRRNIAVKERRQELARWFQEYKATLKCSLCGFSHPAALDFHHKTEHAKEGAVSYLVGRKMCKERILEEIAKCDVLCANCHRIEHWKEKNGPMV